MGFSNVNLVEAEGAFPPGYHVQGTHLSLSRGEWPPKQLSRDGHEAAAMPGLPPRQNVTHKHYPKLPSRHPKSCSACPKDTKCPLPPLAAGLGTHAVHSALLRWLRHAQSPSSQTDRPGPFRHCPTTAAGASCHAYTSHGCRMGFVTYLKFIFFLSLFGSLFITGPL